MELFWTGRQIHQEARRGGKVDAARRPGTPRYHLTRREADGRKLEIVWKLISHSVERRGGDGQIHAHTDGKEVEDIR